MAEYVLMLRFVDVVGELAVMPSALSRERFSLERDSVDVFGSSHLAKMTYKMAS